MISNEQVTKFLEGKNPEKYIVNVEIPYNNDKAFLVINDPQKGKYIKKDNIKSFIWFKESLTKVMYNGKRIKIAKACKKFGVKIKRLKTTLNGEPIHERMKDGFNFTATLDGPYAKLLTFFKQGGIDVYGEEHKKYFMAISPVEQYLIQTGKRLFKGFEDYDDLHRLQFDLETTGLNPKGETLSNKEYIEYKKRIKRIISYITVL